jgi:hypothetical protein
MFGHNNNNNSRGGQNGNTNVCAFFLQGRCKFGGTSKMFAQTEQKFNGLIFDLQTAAATTILLEIKGRIQHNKTDLRRCKMA